MGPRQSPLEVSSQKSYLLPRPHAFRIFHHCLDAVAPENDNSLYVAYRVADSVENILKMQKTTRKSVPSESSFERAQQNNQFRQCGGSEVPERTHSSDWVQRVLDEQQQNFVSTRRVVGIDRPGDPLTGGEVEKDSLISHPDGLTDPPQYTVLGTLNAVKLHQGLSLERHHHHVAANKSMKKVKLKAM